MNNIKEILDSIGLENNESIVYLETIKLGTVPASIIANKLKLPRTTVRYACESLVKKGLLISTIKGNTKLFTAEHPNRIKNLLQIEKNKIEEKENKLNKVMSNIIQMYNPYTKLPKVTFYEGLEGIEKVLWDSLTSKEIIYSFINKEAITEDLNKFNKKYIEERNKLKIRKKTIYSISKNDKDFYNKLGIKINNNLNQIKIINSLEHNFFESKIAVIIYDGKISFITLKEDSYFGVIIENDEIYNYNRNIFNFMWNYL